MTDAEIIKALERWVKCDCEGCTRLLEGGSCTGVSCEEILDLINRLKAENGNLDYNFRTMKGCASYYQDKTKKLEQENSDLLDKLETAKSEARKEFAEFLKARKIIADTSNYYGKECITEVVIVEDIDNLLKEMG